MRTSRLRAWMLASSLCAVAWITSASAATAQLTVHFFDVGQGDAALIVSPEGKTVLVDAGPPESSAALTARVRELVMKPLDLVVLSHPHLDHLGGMREVISAVGAVRFLEPGYRHSSEAYRALLRFLPTAVQEVRTVDTDDDKPLTVGLGGGASLQILWPRPKQHGLLRLTRSDANANSIVARVVFGETSLLFTGDSEAETEAALLEQPFPLRSDVLKVAHHGSRHSSSRAFLEEVRPQLAIISCGAKNAFGHPAEQTLQRLAAVGARTLRTDQDGELLLASDGTQWLVQGRPDLRVRPAPPPPPALGPFVASRGSRVFHKETCRTARSLKPDKRLLYARRQDAASKHTPAKDCRP